MSDYWTKWCRSDYSFLPRGDMTCFQVHKNLFLNLSLYNRIVVNNYTLFNHVLLCASVNRSTCQSTASCTNQVTLFYCKSTILAETPNALCFTWACRLSAICLSICFVLCEDVNIHPEPLKLLLHPQHVLIFISRLILGTAVKQFSNSFNIWERRLCSL